MRAVIYIKQRRALHRAGRRLRRSGIDERSRKGLIFAALIYRYHCGHRRRARAIVPQSYTALDHFARCRKRQVIGDFELSRFARRQSDLRGQLRRCFAFGLAQADLDNNGASRRIA